MLGNLDIPAWVAAGLLLAVLGGLVRNVRLRWRGRSPSVQITPFGWAAEGGEGESLWVTALFRDHLKALRLDGVEAVPDRAPGDPLVEIVEGVGQALGQGIDWSRVIGRLYRTVLPDCAYEVWATLKPEGEGRGSISIQLIKRAGGDKTLVNFTSKVADWEAGAREAAMAAAGALYPHLSNRHKGPWCDWKSPVPPGLLGRYQDGLRYERQDQFEQALSAFRETVEGDPLNPQLRLKAAMLEERLDLHLDAWFTYWAIVAECDRRVWKGGHRRTRLVALYRLAIHLWNPKLAEQWARGPAPGDACEGEVKLRKELRSALEREPVFADGSTTCTDGAATADAAELMGALAAEQKRDAPSDLVELFSDEECGAVGSQEIAAVLQIVSLGRLQELNERMSRYRTRIGVNRRARRARRPPLRRRLGRKELQPLAVEASELLVRAQVARSAEARLEAKGGIHPDVKAGHGTLLRRWPFPHWKEAGPAAVLRRRARIWLGQRRGDAWQLHYNAACTIATQLFPDSLRRDRTETETAKWIKAAIRQLELFSYYAGSGRVAAMADWIALEDPDLAQLYSEPLFRLWGSQRFGFGLPRERMPLEHILNRRTARIVKRSAGAFSAAWRDRATRRSIPPSAPALWWEQELEIWERLQETCKEPQHWECRLKSLEALEAWNAANEPVVDVAREVRDPRGGSGENALPATLFDDLGDVIAGTSGVMQWVGARVEAAAAAHDWLLARWHAKGVATLPQAERDAAMRASLIWADLEAVLTAALRSDRELDWSGFRARFASADRLPPD